MIVLGSYLEVSVTTRDKNLHGISKGGEAWRKVDFLLLLFIRDKVSDHHYDIVFHL